MNRKKKERTRKRLFRIFGAMLAMCLMLTSISVHMIFAGPQDPNPKKSDLIPGSITIEEPKALSKVALPASSYGTLTWKDGTAVPSSYSGSYEVVFTAAADCTADFSGIKDFDSKTRTLKGTVTVYVKSLAPAPTETPAVAETPAPTETPAATETPAPTETPAATETPVPTETPAATETPAPTETPEATETPAPTETPEATETPAPTETPAATETPAPTETPEATETPAPTETPEATETPAPTETPEATETPAPTETPDVTETPAPEPETPMDLVEEEQRPQSASEEMSAEEQAAMAAQNHTSEGITVSADFLPWYVQFRVSDGSGFGFRSAEDAATFQAYEFQLWDLLNDTEYEIPEGKTVQVTMPVIAGYEYSIEHILPDGTVETIVPQVYGDTLVFTTDSFSPFGIAGSKPLVGGDIADNGYGSGTSSSGSSSGNNSAGSATTSGNKTAGTQNSSSGSSSAGNRNNGSSQNSSSSGSSSSGRTVSRPGAVRTGDNTNIMPLVVIGLGALIVILAVVFSILHRRKK